MEIIKDDEKKLIEVIAYFSLNDLKIIKFRSDKSVFKVSSLISTWKLKQGQEPVTHFAVECAEQKVVCELSFNHHNCKWEFVKFDHLD